MTMQNQNLVGMAVEAYKIVLVIIEKILAFKQQ